MRPKSVIGKANELVEQHGKDHAIKYFQEKIDEMGEPKNFEQLCKISGWLTAISHIKGEILY